MKKRVLIVDDEIESFGFLPDVLEEYGYGVVTINDGENAVELAEKSFYDIVLMDFNLPGINGLDAFRRIKRLSPLSFVIIMTAAAPEEMLTQALKEGSFAILHKPFKVDQVVDMVDAALARTKVMIVDPAASFADDLPAFLEKNECKCAVLGAGADALGMLRQNRPDVLFITLPHDASLELLSEVRRLHPDMPVIAADPDEHAERREQALRLGASSVMRKPFDMNQLLSVIDRIRREQHSGAAKPAVLLVEDDAALRQTLAVILSTHQYEVTTVGTGQDAVKEAKKKFYQAAVVDFRLPDLSGIEVIKRLREINKDAVIILMTAYGNLDVAIDAIKEHIFDFLVKPVDPKVILKSLRKGIAARHE